MFDDLKTYSGCTEIHDDGLVEALVNHLKLIINNSGEIESRKNTAINALHILENLGVPIVEIKPYSAIAPNNAPVVDDLIAELEKL